MGEKAEEIVIGIIIVAAVARWTSSRPIARES